MAHFKKDIANHLLSIGAVELSPDQPFTWSSGIQSPIYCDNRLTLSYPDIRQQIALGLCGLIKEHFDSTEVIAGTATAGIPHAAWVAHEMTKPMCYVRSSAKGHGKQNQIEGRINAGDKVVVVEDLISTGGSSLKAVEALREQKADVLGVVAIFTYGFEKAEQAFQEANVPFYTLTDYSTLIEVALTNGKLSEEQHKTLQKWKPL